MFSHPLYVIAPISNPLRLKSRIALAKTFIQHVLNNINVRLFVVECSYNDLPYELSHIQHANYVHVPVKASTVLWCKENLLNIGINHLPVTAKYIATIDSDITFRDPNWSQKIIHALQFHDVVQCWSETLDLGPRDEILAVHKSFAYQYTHGHPVIPEKLGQKIYGHPHPHPGYAWAYTRSFLDGVGGLFEHGVVGSGDNHMALGLIGAAEKSFRLDAHPNYIKLIRDWSDRATEIGRYNIGYVQNTIEHTFHGWKHKRGYLDRWQILINNQYDPLVDTMKNSFGVLEFVGSKKVELQRDVLRYFQSRDEDPIS